MNIVSDMLLQALRHPHQSDSASLSSIAQPTPDMASDVPQLESNCHTILPHSPIASPTSSVVAPKYQNYTLGARKAQRRWKRMRGVWGRKAYLANHVADKANEPLYSGYRLSAEAANSQDEV
jgi:hypothetical protein